MKDFTLTEIIEQIEMWAGDIESDTGADWNTERDRARSIVDLGLCLNALGQLRFLLERQNNNISNG